MVTLALMGDTMLGRMVGRALATRSPSSLVAPEVVALAGEADLRLLNLECCISERGERWPAPGKPFFFRAPPAAVDVLDLLQVDCVTLANNHILDYGVAGLLDTTAFLDDAGIAWVGAGPDRARARAPVVLEAVGYRLTVLGITDHPRDYAAGDDRPGVAWADLGHGVPAWVLDTVAAADTDGVLVSPHWGPNMVAEPRTHVRRAASALREAGATLVAGHSAHVVQGVEDAVFYDLGDFIDDYATDLLLRNDLGLLFLVQLEHDGPRRLEAVPLKLDYCHTRLAHGTDAAWVRRRFRTACAAFGTEVREEGDRLVVTWC
jgi:poly-gamma-glutamate capsule biosynthesis protein CapA/YwtB (metallophosphatase superfamily)